MELGGRTLADMWEVPGLGFSPGDARRGGRKKIYKIFKEGGLK